MRLDQSTVILLQRNPCNGGTWQGTTPWWTNLAGLGNSIPRGKLLVFWDLPWLLQIGPRSLCPPRFYHTTRRRHLWQTSRPSRLHGNFVTFPMCGVFPACKAGLRSSSSHGWWLKESWAPSEAAREEENCQGCPKCHRTPSNRADRLPITSSKCSCFNLGSPSSPVRKAKSLMSRSQQPIPQRKLDSKNGISER